MPKQEGQPPFGDGELLYRRLVQKWIGVGDTVEPEAIEIPQCSVDRGLLSTAKEALDRGNTHEIAVASVRFHELPACFDAEAPAKTYEIVVASDPTASNSAHTHIETRQAGEPGARKPSAAAMKQRIRAEIAAALRVTLKR